MRERRLNLEAQDREVVGQEQGRWNGSVFMLSLTVPVDLARGGGINCGSFLIKYIHAWHIFA